MYLSRLAVNVASRHFRRDYADVQHMHRTLANAFPEVAKPTEGGGQVKARKAHEVLWRLDVAQSGYTLLVQSRTEPDWTALPADYLAADAQVRPLQPVLDTVRPGARFAFRLVANPTKALFRRGDRGTRVPLRSPDQQVQWLARQGERWGFVIPTAMGGGPDVVPAPAPELTGYRKQDTDEARRSIASPRTPDSGTTTATSGGAKTVKIVLSPVRFDGGLVVTDPAAFTDGLVVGIGRGKAYGCGLLSLGPAPAVPGQGQSF